MIIVITCSHFPDDERIFYRQINSLLENGLSVTYFTYSNSSIDLSNGLLKHYNYNKRITLRQYMSNVLSDISGRTNITHVQIHETSLLSIFRRIKSLSANISTIYDVHEDMESLYRTFSKRSKLIKETFICLRLLNEKLKLKYVDHIILANRVIEHNPYSSYNIPLSVIENFPGTSFIKKSLNIDKKKYKIIYHGHLSEERGISDLVTAMRSVKVKLNNPLLSLVGTFRTKTFELHIKRLIADFDLSDTVQIIDQVPYSKISDILGEHSVGVIPLRRTPMTKKNTPTKLFEMMAAGLEIVASDLLPMRQFVNHSIHWSIPGNILSISDAIIRASTSLLNDPSNVQENQRLIKKEFNWESKKEQYVSIFKD